VAEAKEELFFGLDVFEELWDFVDGPDALNHADDGFVGAAMEGAVEGGGGSGDGGLPRTENQSALYLFTPPPLPQGKSEYGSE